MYSTQTVAIKHKECRVNATNDLNEYNISNRTIYAITTPVNSCALVDAMIDAFATPLH